MTLITGAHVDSPRPISVIRSQHVDATPSQRYDPTRKVLSSYAIWRRLSDCMLSATFLKATIQARLLLRVVCVGSLFCACSLFVNVAYVSLNFYSSLQIQMRFGLQLAMAVIRPLLLSICVSLFKWRPLLFGVHPAMLETAPGFLRGDEASQLFFLVFESLIAPCIAAALCDRTCFADAIRGSNLVTLSFKRVHLKSRVVDHGLSENTSLNFTSEYTENVKTTRLSYYPPFLYKVRNKELTILIIALAPFFNTPRPLPPPAHPH